MTTKSTAAVSVLVISHVSNMWGAERRLLDIAPLLANEGVKLTLASPPGEFADAWILAGHDWVALNLGPHQGLRQPDSRQRPGVVALATEASSVLRSSVAIARMARGFDLVQSHSLMAHLEVATAGILARRPVILDLHDLVEKGLGQRVLRLASRLATASLANSSATAQTVGGTSAKVHVVHPGVDTSRFFPGPPNPLVRVELTSRPDAPLVGILGRVDPNKGVNTLVEALGRPGNGLGHVHLAIIGREHVASGEFAANLRYRAESLLGDRVRFIAPRDDVPDVLRSLDIMVNASRHEPFGRTVLESQACGIPVIATEAGGIPEFVENELTGLLVPPMDAPALEAALERLVNDEDLRVLLTKEGAMQASVHFSVTGQAQAAGAVYRLAAKKSA
ncbi:MAG: glycosyltransferase family 4 protein [Acidimicrobiales bacterium]